MNRDDKNRYPRITIDDIWASPAETKKSGKYCNPSGCPFLDTLNRQVLLGRHRHPTEVAKVMGITPQQVFETVKTITNMTACEWMNALTLRMASYYLLHTTWPLSKIANEIGFNSASALSKFYRANAGCTTRKFRSENRRVVTKTVKEITVNKEI